jgi:uncharacterized oligopeptide transporter (OPT) family protein
VSAADPPPAPDAPAELRGVLDVRTVITGILVATIMGASYPYITLKLGFGPNVSVVAAFFGFLILRVFELATRRSHYNRWQNNLAEAAGTSAAQTAFMCILLGGFDILRHARPDIFSLELTPLKSFAWLSVACTLGVLLAVPLRRHFVVDEKLPYADGLAASETLIVMDPPRDASPEIKRNALAAFKAVMLGVGLSGLVMLLRSDSKLIPLLPEGWEAPWHYLGHGVDMVANKKGELEEVMSGVILANLGVGAQYSLLNIGSGMIVGLRINLSMLLGGVFAWIVVPYFLMSNQIPLHHIDDHGVSKMVFNDTPTRNEILFWVMWPATGMLVVGGITALVLRWKLLVETFRSLRSARIGSSEFPLQIVAVGVVVCAVALCIVQSQMLGMPVWMTLSAIVLSVPLMLVGLRVLGETNWGPISALSNMMQGVFAAISPGNVAANMVASGTTGTIATSSESIMQDYKCGHVIGSKPRNITIMQLVGVPIGAAAVSWVYPLLVKAYGIYDTVDPNTGKAIKAGLSSPVSNKWSGFAQVLKDGASALPSSALYAAIIFSVLGVVFTVLEANPKLRKFVPSPTGVGIGILVGFNVVFVMMLGGLIGWLWERKHKASADIYLLPLASGLIAGEAIVAVLGSLYLAATG